MSTRPWTTPGIESLPDLMGLTHQGDGHSRGLVRGLDGDDAADDPHQSLSLIIVDPTNPHTFSHRASLAGISACEERPRAGNVACYGTSYPSPKVLIGLTVN